MLSMESAHADFPRFITTMSRSRNLALSIESMLCQISSFEGSPCGSVDEIKAAAEVNRKSPEAVLTPSLFRIGHMEMALSALDRKCVLSAPVKLKVRHMKSVIKRFLSL